MKTVYLLDRKGDFIAFGAGMFLVNNQDNTIKVGLLVGPSVIGGFDLSAHPTDKDAAGAHAAWIQAIIAAPEGALLRWDVERGCVVDELAPADDVFADDYDPALLDPFAVDANPVHCPVCGCEMVMDYDGGELVCSSEECDARQPIEWPEKFVQGVTEMVVGRPLQIPTYAPSAPQEVAG